MDSVNSLYQLGGTVVIASIALGIFLKIISQMVSEQKTERTSWYSEQGRQADRVAKAIEELARSMK